MRVNASARAVSIHSAGLPAEKLPRLSTAIRADPVSIHSAGLPAEKLLDRASGRIRHKCFNPLRWSSSGETVSAISISGLQSCFNPLRWSSSGETIQGLSVGILFGKFQSTPLVFQRRNDYLIPPLSSLSMFQSTPLVFQRRNAPGCQELSLCLRVSIHSAGLPAEKRR